jgi:hypothetical protein
MNFKTEDTLPDKCRTGCLFLGYLKEVQDIKNLNTFETIKQRSGYDEKG